MDKRIRISIIVPVYNVEKYIKRCLYSLIEQTFQDIEIIVVNDGATDHSQDIIDEVTNMYPHLVKCYIKANGGLADARNYGLSKANGEYIGFIDSDDYVDATMFEKLYTKAIAEDADIVTCGYYGIDENKGTFRHFQQGKLEHYGKNIEQNPQLLTVNAVYAWNKLYKRSLFIETGIRFPKGIIFEDMATIWPLFLHANKICKVDEPLYYYILKRKGAIMATYSDRLLQMFKSMAIVNTYYKKYNKFEEYYNILCFLNIKHTILRFKDFPNFPKILLKKKVLQEGFKHLHTYFPDWDRNELFFKTFYGDRIGSKLLKYKSFWFCYMFVPRQFLHIAASFLHFIKKVKRGIQKRSYITKYYYAHLCKKNNINEKQVLFESFQGTTISDSPFYMMKELSKQNEYIIYIATSKNKIKEHQVLLKRYDIKANLVSVYSMKYQYALATSKYLVNNVSFPPYFIRRKGQKYLNTWHGTPLKTLGKQMVAGIQDMSNIQRNFLQSTCLLFPNIFTKEHIMQDYNLKPLYSHDIFVHGYPRNAIFSIDSNEKKREKYNLVDKEVIAYMPTWRGAASSDIRINEYKVELEEILKLAEQTLSEHQVLYVNLHSLLRSHIQIKEYKRIFPFPIDVDNYEFLSLCDVLITDYSSVFFDFSITEKPIALFMYDYKQYIKDRGMYIALDEMPFDKLYTKDDFVQYLKSDKILHNTNVWEGFKQTYTEHNTIDNANIVNQYFFHDKDEQNYNSHKSFTVYFMPKIKSPDDLEYMKTIEDKEAIIYIFDRQDFTPILHKFLLENQDILFIVMDIRMQLTLFQQIKKIFKYKLSPQVYEKELQRILPHVSIHDAIDKKNSAYTRGLCNVIHIRSTEEDKEWV